MIENFSSLKEYLFRDLPDIRITPEDIEKLKGDPNTTTRQYMGLVRTPEEVNDYKTETLKRSLP